MQVEERYAAAEAAAEAKRLAKMRRQPLYLIAIFNSLVIAVACIRTVDLHRLATPQGVALRWTQAAVLGGCDDYLSFSVGPDTEQRPRAELCKDLADATKDARLHNSEIGLRLVKVTTSGSTAAADLLITRSKDEHPVVVDLVRRGGHWRVLRDATTCASVGCA